MAIEIAEDNDDDLYWNVNPDHSAFYKQWIEPIQFLGWQLGYSIGVHGSLKRDLDMIAVPWIETAASGRELAIAICELIDGRLNMDPRYNPGIKPHGRRAWSIHFYGKDYRNIHKYVDLSVMPRTKDLQDPSWQSKPSS